jgi:hypothetical protein
MLDDGLSEAGQEELPNDNEDELDELDDGFSQAAQREPVNDYGDEEEGDEEDENMRMIGSQYANGRNGRNGHTTVIIDDSE